MAKGIDINGTLRGKRGGIVYYRANGEQLSRPRVTPRNPKSAKQAVQRMVLAGASKLAAAYRPIINHSSQGLPVGEKQVNAFRARTMTQLRNAAAIYFGGEASETILADFPLKGSTSTGFINGLQISKGSLTLNEFLPGPEDEVYLRLSEGAQFSALTREADTLADYEAALAALGLVPGDQLTLVLHSIDKSSPVATFAYGDGYLENDFQDIVRFARVTFSPSFVQGEPLLIMVDGMATFNPEIIVDSQGAFPPMEEGAISGKQCLVMYTGLSDEIIACGLIRSQKQECGDFKYSTTSMKAFTSNFDSNNAYPTYLSYMAGASKVEVGDTLYLQNAVAQPN